MKGCKTEHSFTLLEIFIVITLVGICSMVGFNIYKGVAQYSFSSTAKRIEEKISFAHRMATMQGIDVFILMSLDKKGMFCEITAEERQSLLNEEQTQKDFFKKIFFSFNGQEIDNLSIGFSSSGSIFPKGKIKLFDNKGRSKEVDLEGFLEKEGKSPLHPFYAK